MTRKPTSAAVGLPPCTAHYSERDKNTKLYINVNIKNYDDEKKRKKTHKHTL